MIFNFRPSRQVLTAHKVNGQYLVTTSRLMRGFWMVGRFIKVVSIMAIFFFLPQRLWPDRLFCRSEDYRMARGGCWEWVDDGHLRYHRYRFNKDGNDVNPNAVWESTIGGELAEATVAFRSMILYALALIAVGVAIGRLV